jgi:hypothetical protein
MTNNEKRSQVIDQCKVVAHLADVLAKVHRDYEMLFVDGKFDNLIDQVGRRTAGIMDDLGDILNGMDAVSADDDWTYPIFEKREQFGFGSSTVTED